MSTLYERRNPVFTDTAANSGCVLDARLHWTSAAQTSAAALTPEIVSGLTPGATRVAELAYTSGAYCSIGFVGQHPIHSAVYYSLGVECSAAVTIYGQYVVDNKIYVTDGQVYCVKMLGTQEIHSTVAWGGGYILIDLESDDSSHISGATIEPFNVIFDPVGGSAGETDITFNGSVSIANNVFTNTPLIFGHRETTLGSFLVSGNELSISATLPNVGYTSQQYIKSINGIAPVDGNFVIQVIE